MQTQTRIWWLKLLPLYDQTDDPVSGKHESLVLVVMTPLMATVALTMREIFISDGAWIVCKRQASALYSWACAFLSERRPLEWRYD
jgi:hypothetical protein